MELPPLPVFSSSPGGDLSVVMLGELVLGAFFPGSVVVVAYGLHCHWNLLSLIDCYMKARKFADLRKFKCLHVGFTKE